MPKVSVVIPLYKCAPMIEELSARLIQTLELINSNFEIIFVNDASPDLDWQIVKRVIEQESRIKGINLSRNFGQHYAITAGLNHTSGEWIVVMDGDLQDKPEEIVALFEAAQQGYDIVVALRNQRKDHWLKKMSSQLFYRVFSYLTDTIQDARVANFGIYHRKVIEAILDMQDSIKYFPTQVQWVGFKTTKISVTHGKREEGESSYTMRNLLKLAFHNIIAFSDKPLRLTVSFGFSITIIALLFAIITVFRYVRGEIMVSGYASLIFSIWFLSGLIIAILGIVGIYVGKVFERVKQRPPFIIADKINFPDAY